MAVSKMKLVNISGSLEALGAVTRACGESGVFQPDDTLSYYSDTSAFSVVRLMVNSSNTLPSLVR